MFLAFMFKLIDSFAAIAQYLVYITNACRLLWRCHFIACYHKYPFIYICNVMTWHCNECPTHEIMMLPASGRRITSATELHTRNALTKNGSDICVVSLANLCPICPTARI